MRKLITCAALTIFASGIANVAYAGEVTGGPRSKPTPAGERASSICAFSGQEDGYAMIIVNGVPVFIEVAKGPGRVQTPHHENSAGITHPPGAAGSACRGN
jgi:hypothetical protein